MSWSPDDANEIWGKAFYFKLFRYQFGIVFRQGENTFAHACHIDYNVYCACVGTAWFGMEAFVEKY
jgi:hypothetical protein